MPAPRFLRWLTLLALLLAPLGMIGAAPAMAHHGSAAAGHCPESEDSRKAPTPIDCMMTCAGLPAQVGSDLAAPLLEASPQPQRSLWVLHGLHPEMTIPPPRHA